MSFIENTKTRNKSIVTGIFGGFMGRSVSLLAPFIVMPAMLRHLGDVHFGIWMTAVSITSAAMFIDFGIGNGLLTRLSTAFGTENHPQMRGYIASAYIALSTIALAILAPLVIAALLLNAGWLKSIAQEYNKESINIILSCFIVFVLGVPTSIIQRIMYACQDAWQSNAWQILAAALSVSLSITAISYKLSPWQIVSAYSLPPVATMLASTIYFFIKHPQIRPKKNDFSRAYATDLLKIGGRFLILSIITSIALNVDNIIIAQRLGPEVVTEYSIPAKLASLLGLVVTTLFLPLWAANGAAIARRDWPWIRRTMLKMSMLGSIILLATGTTLVLSGDFIIEKWMERAFESQTEILAALALVSLLMAATSPFNMLLNSAGQIKIQIKAWLVFLIISATLKFFLIPTNGIWIIPLTTAITYLLVITPSITISALGLIRKETQ